MSYILDALNKSEQERQSKQTPGLNSIHRQPVPTQKKSMRWLLVLIVLAVVNGAGIYFWLQQSNVNKPAESQKMPTSASASILTEKATGKGTEKATEKRTVNTITLEKPEIRSTDPLVNINNQAPKVLETLKLVKFSDLPPSIKKDIPDFNFSTHLYGEDKEFRMVNINGTTFREGEAIREGESTKNGIQLVEITVQGVILKYKNYLFEVDVLTNWKSH